MKKRIAYLQKVKPGCVRAYRRFHRNVWPELEAAYREAGFTDLSCFLKGTTLVVYIEYDTRRFSRRRAWLKANEVERRWQGIMNTLKDGRAGSLELAEIYRFPARTRR